MRSQTGKKSLRIVRGFPRHTLEKALAVSKAIQDNNAGRPMKRLLLADALGMSPSSSEFRVILSSSIQYGLTSGSEKAESVELTPLGRSAVAPLDQAERQRALQKAALTPELFGRVFTHYNQGKWPSATFLKNALQREFDVDAAVADECIENLQATGTLTGLLREISGSAYVMLENVLVPNTDEPTESSSQAVPLFPEKAPQPPPAKPADEGPSIKPGYIFVGHGKNKKPLEQLKRVLDQFRVPNKIAEEEPNQGRPISEKVGDVMKQCNSAILIFTADEEFRDLGGSPIFRPSENVVHELGAASFLYGKRIVIFKEDGVQLPSNFRDIGYISFEKDRLDAKASDLISELVGFGILKVTTA